ncbi:MAG TPA: ribosome small subunit-dependent GTPase A, partial [Planctomycetaceae bacterium]|nr:ribosome small subunit-dependent GTPase A [Planctomycetaceae bacterium]
MAKKQKGKSRKVRTQLRKGYQKRTRQGDLTREYEQHGFKEQDLAYGERVSGKGELTRHRTIIGESSDTDDDGFQVQLDVELQDSFDGLVISVHGRTCQVEDESGNIYSCAVRGLLKTLNTDQRHVVAAGDRVIFRHEGSEGMILRVEPRKGIISRDSRGKQHVIVANVDQLLIVASVLQPELKPNLIDRLIITAEKGELRPIICFNKVDLLDPAELQSIAGVYGQLGYTTLFCSCET